MPTPDLDPFVALAEAIADGARTIALRHFRATSFDDKADGTPVTAADREIEAFARALIAERAPDHGVIGEEEAPDRPDAEYVWVLDPIDGTKAFISGTATFATLVALVHRGRPVVGVIDQAVTDERWVGVEGRPTTFRGAPCRVRAPRPIEQSVLCLPAPEVVPGELERGFRALTAAGRWSVYQLDAYGYGLCAAGHIDVVVEHGLGPHDFCALVPVVTGAGGTIVDWQGRPLELGSGGNVVAASHVGLADRARELAGSTG